MKRIVISIIFGMILGGNAFSQYANEAILFSQNYAGGTARSLSMGGAFGALGGDLSVLSTNPAGLGVYRGSEFTFTPALSFTNTETLFDDHRYTDRNTRFILNNIGYVYTWNYHKPKGLQSLSFGIAYNRLSDFNSDSYIYSAQAGSSLLDEFVWYANGGRSGSPIDPNSLDPFYEQLAYDLYVINDDKYGYYNNEYQLTNSYGKPMRRTMKTRGGIGEYDFSLGTNINHKLFFGVTLGIQDVYYEEYYYHTENPRFETLNGFSFSDNHSISGWGINFKAGVIYRPIQSLRLGFSMHTPTHFWLKPLLVTELKTDFNKAPTSEEYDTYRSVESDPDYNKYRSRTPWRYNFSAAYVLGSLGLFSLDAEYVDYSKAKLLPESDYSDENDDVAAYYKSNWNIKGGTEFRVGPVYLRGGIAWYGSPYEKPDGADKDYFKGTMSYSGGVGFRMRNFYVDAAYSYIDYPKKNILLYTIDEEYEANTDITTASNRVLVTFGFKF